MTHHVSAFFEVLVGMDADALIPEERLTLMSMSNGSPFNGAKNSQENVPEQAGTIPQEEIENTMAKESSEANSSSLSLGAEHHDSTFNDIVGDANNETIASVKFEDIAEDAMGNARDNAVAAESAELSAIDNACMNDSATLPDNQTNINSDSNVSVEGKTTVGTSVGTTLTGSISKSASPSNSSTTDNCLKPSNQGSTTTQTPNGAASTAKGTSFNINAIKNNSSDPITDKASVLQLNKKPTEEVDHLDVLLSGIKRDGFMHNNCSSHNKQEDEPLAQRKGMVLPSQLEQVIGSWYYDQKQGGFAIDSTMAAILGIRNFNGFLDADEIFKYIDPVKREHIQHCMESPLLGDLLFRNVTIVKGANFGKRFTFQGQILTRTPEGKATKAIGSLAYESSPYAEFLTREIANDGLFIWDRKLHSIIYNTAFHQLLEYGEEEFPSTLQELMGLVHPDDNDILSLQGHILSYPQYGDSYECCVRLKSATQKYIWATVRTLVTERNSDGMATKLIGAVTNIDLLQENFDNLKLLMFTDPLTGLHNRTYFHQNQLRYEDPKLAPVSVIFLDVSALKLTNDILGHNYGDFLLLKASQLLQNALQVTLTELKADQSIVDALISRRTALSDQTKLLSSTFGTKETVVGDINQNGPILNDALTTYPAREVGNEGNDISDVNKACAGFNGSSTVDNEDYEYHEAQDNARGNDTLGKADLEPKGAFEIQFKSDETGAGSIDLNSSPLGNDGPGESITITTSTILQETKGTPTTDCLDNPSGCLINDNDLTSSERAILELPSNFFNELESLGVTTISMSGDAQDKDNTTESASKTVLDPSEIRIQSPGDVLTQSNTYFQDASRLQPAKTALKVTGLPQLSEADEEVRTQGSKAEQDRKAIETSISDVESFIKDAAILGVGQPATEASVAAQRLEIERTLSVLEEDTDTDASKKAKSKPTLKHLQNELSAEILSKQDIKYPPEILRMGGDEFIVLFPNCDEHKIKRLYENIFKIRDLLLKNQETTPIEQRAVPLCFGIGYATVGEGEVRNDDFLQALQRADYRMQANKEKYHDQHYELLQAYFEEKLHRRVSMRDERRMQILSHKERNKLRQHLED